MNLNHVSLPYPVLGVSDDVRPPLANDSVKITYGNSKLEYVLNVALKVNNPCIEKLIADGYAQYVCEIDCPATNFRESVRSIAATFSFTIDRRYVSGNVVLSCYVTVIKDIANYANPGFHEDYAGAVFNLTPGDILVGFPVLSFVADEKFDGPQSATSFMEIRRDTYNDYTTIDYTDKTIDIKLPAELFDIYKSGIDSTYTEVIHASLVFNALLEALYVINEHSSSIWAQALVNLMQNNTELDECVTVENGQIDISDKARVATILLKDPYRRMFYKLNSVNSVDTSYDD